MVIYYGTAQAFGINIDRTLAAVFIVSINTGAYMSEIVRGGISVSYTHLPTMLFSDSRSAVLVLSLDSAVPRDLPVLLVWDVPKK